MFKHPRSGVQRNAGLAAPRTASGRPCAAACTQSRLQRRPTRPLPPTVRAAAALLLAAAAAVPPAAAVPLSERVGYSHVNSLYYFGSEPYMVEGAKRILDTGSRVIKLWFNSACPEYYAFNDSWPKFNTLVELAEAPSFKKVFAMPFKVYILTAYPPGKEAHYWRDGMSEAKKKAETDAFDAITTHLLTTYKGTGKTFVLQHWEGDWSIGRPTAPGNDDWMPDPKAVQGMIDWLNARQDGVERARKKLNVQGCHVYHAAEVNKIDIALNGKKGAVVDLVIPKTHCDLYSYSAYDTSIPQRQFKQALEYYAARAPDSKAFGAKNVFIGEYGIPENEFPPKMFQEVIQNTTQTALDFGCPYVVYWQLYCNELKKEAQGKEKPVKRNEDCRGFWLIRPDGSKSWAWDYFEKLIKSGRGK